MKFSASDVSIMNRLYKNGVSIKTIANSFNCDPTSVGYHVNNSTKNRKIGRYIKKRISSLSDTEAYNFVANYNY